jgi:hypothetical protein
MSARLSTKEFGVNVGLALGRLSLLRWSNKSRMKWRRGLFCISRSSAPNVRLRNKRMLNLPRPNRLPDADTQPMVAASRLGLCAGQRQRYAA